jgi:hypothetical protein
MFGIMGVLLVGYGAAGDQSIYAKSLGININVIWGSVLLLFAAVMLILARRAARRDAGDRA